MKQEYKRANNIYKDLSDLLEQAEKRSKMLVL